MAIYLYNYLSVQLSICIVFYLYSYISVQLSFCIAIYLYSYLSVQLSICITIYLYYFLFVQLSICISIYLYGYLCIPGLADASAVNPRNHTALLTQVVNSITKSQKKNILQWAKKYCYHQNAKKLVLPFKNSILRKQYSTFLYWSPFSCRS